LRLRETPNSDWVNQGLVDPICKGDRVNPKKRAGEPARATDVTAASKTLSKNPSRQSLVTEKSNY
jgi:hypothetical protein